MVYKFTVEQYQIAKKMIMFTYIFSIYVHLHYTHKTHIYDDLRRRRLVSCSQYYVRSVQYELQCMQFMHEERCFVHPVWYRYNHPSACSLAFV